MIKYNIFQMSLFIMDMKSCVLFKPENDQIMFKDSVKWRFIENIQFTFVILGGGNN